MPSPALPRQPTSPSRSLLRRTSLLSSEDCRSGQLDNSCEQALALGVSLLSSWSFKVLHRTLSCRDLRAELAALVLP